MENINIGDFLGELFIVIMFLAGVVTIIGGAVAIIKKWHNSSKTKKQGDIINEHTEQIKVLDHRVEKLEAKADEQDRYISVMCNSMLALLDYNINGESTEKLKHARDDMEDYLISKK